MITSLATPGVYINEINAFPNTVVPVATAVPAFIGYTPQASYEGQSYLMKPVKISSMQDFLTFFGYPADPATNTSPKQYNPEYYAVKQKKAPEKGKSYHFNGDIYTVEPDPYTVYYLYNSVKLFYQNGGGTAYIVSVGGYGPASNTPNSPGDPVLNGNVTLADLQAGMAKLLKLPEVTMYVFPEATLLATDENGTLMQSALEQAAGMQTAFCLFDVQGGLDPDPELWDNDIETFRNNTGINDLKYGAAYYPFIDTTAMASGDIDYTNLNGGAANIDDLSDLLNPATSPNTQAASILSSIKAGGSLTVQQNNQALLIASKTYKQLMSVVLNKVNTLPPSGVMAGVYTLVDSTEGVWKAPANVSAVGVSDVTIRLDDTEQAGLNIDAVTGKSVNALRYFNGFGVLVWGARTLDGNSGDWKYINVRRTVTMIEQSLKDALRTYVFAPNTANTWATIKSMCENFLTNEWKLGALAGSKATDAFSVQIGLGSTMTAQDITDGNLKLTVLLAVSHPAEFIVLSVEQQQQKS